MEHSLLFKLLLLFCKYIYDYLLVTIQFDFFIHLFVFIYLSSYELIA